MLMHSCTCQSSSRWCLQVPFDALMPAESAFPERDAVAADRERLQMWRDSVPDPGQPGEPALRHVAHACASKLLLAAPTTGRPACCCCCCCTDWLTRHSQIGTDPAQPSQLTHSSCSCRQEPGACAAHAATSRTLCVSDSDQGCSVVQTAAGSVCSACCNELRVGRLALTRTPLHVSYPACPAALASLPPVVAAT